MLSYACPNISVVVHAVPVISIVVLCCLMLLLLFVCFLYVSCDFHCFPLMSDAFPTIVIDLEKTVLVISFVFPMLSYAFHIIANCVYAFP